MPTFKLERNGVPFTIRDAESEEVANQLLDDSIAERPDMLGAKAVSLGMDFDQATQTGRKFSTAEKFAIGFDKSVTDVMQSIGDIFSSDELTAIELNKRANEQKAFDILNGPDSDAAGFGEFAGDAAMLMVGLKFGGGAVVSNLIKQVGKPVFALARMASGFSLFGAGARQFIKSAAKTKLTGQGVQQAATHPAGRAAIKKLTTTTNPKTVDTLVNTISKNANKRVRAAQIRANRILRAQETQAEAQGVQVATTANAELAAAQGAARTTATQRGAQSSLKAEAKGALKVPGGATKPVETAAARAELIKGIGFKGQGPGQQATRAIESASQRAKLIEGVGFKGS